jgi:hypothetical protein
MEKRVNPSSLPVGENILMAAFRAVVEGRDARRVDLAEAYSRHFTTVVPAPPIKPHNFERFSLVDPAVTLTVRSSTVAT